MIDKSRVPVIVGAHQITDTLTPPDTARGPKALLVDAVRGAATDCGAPEILREVDHLTVVRLFSDTLPRFASPFGRMNNPPWSVANAIGATPREMRYTTAGGHTPQTVVSHFCREISEGRSACAVLVGAEALRTQLAAIRAGLELDWAEEAPDEPESFGIERASFSELEDKYGLNAAIYGYPIIEQAIRQDRGLSMDQHQFGMGRLMARLAAVARDNPLATRRWGPDAHEISTHSDKNPYVGFPYTKLMNSNVYVDQSAALILCSAELADRHGIAENKRVYLHGCAAGNDHWYVSERAELHRSPAIRGVVRRAMERAGVGVDDLSFFDIYSCFPSAVQIASREIGLAEDDPRNVTVTGGLPFFGGPGNNFVTHSIVQMVQQLRATPGRYGLVTANGSYLAKHAAGVYSTRPLEHTDEVDGSEGLQAELDQIPKAPLTDKVEGPARIESYTLAVGRNGPTASIILGRLVRDDRRFIANTQPDPSLLLRMMQNDYVGATGAVRVVDGKCRFFPGG
ncbi:hypothetical protein [Alloalcanivorax xenomutans]|uniref:Acetyl-CoA acetyltransferase n=1 Tax=Alloalcanivorax xenomutans TaxID=1094342 RepID=A0A9Q3W9P4_9GAMM|nr:hypothetical protein [Alloalcanivorax xenomutans]ARB47161.1 hypothetical protein P40_18585 [Alloalcanivorax xenomutans]MCE7510803.1 acetyl-CoA acetyltransferase [Alloalcanivorax xenomutans]MCE7525318.1 acetyl-CoA acetyltransferase [Alloalcanivorax xenomutans]